MPQLFLFKRDNLVLCLDRGPSCLDEPLQSYLVFPLSAIRENILASLSVWLKKRLQHGSATARLLHQGRPTPPTLTGQDPSV